MVVAVTSTIRTELRKKKKKKIGSGEGDEDFILFVFMDIVEVIVSLNPIKPKR